LGDTALAPAKLPEPDEAVVTNPLKALVDHIWRRARESRAHAEHLDRIIEAGRQAMLTHHHIERPTVRHMSQDPPPPMRHMPRTGPAWFLAFVNPKVRGLVFVEVDDATEQVTRVSATPR
jgi:hypothetical protein